MFDKMHLRTTEKIEARRLIEMGAALGSGDGQYRKSLSIEVGKGKKVLFRLDPYYQSAMPSIEFNPSKFEHWSEIESFLSMMAPLDSYEIDRLDHAVDKNISFCDARRSIKIKRKQTEYSYKQADSRRGITEEGMRRGEKPEVFCIYDKACEVSSRFKFKPIPGAKLGLSTRFEVRHFNRKVLFPKLSQIKNYIENNPFEKIDSYELNENCSDDDKLEDIRRRLQDISLDEFYVRKNTSGNFWRTFGHCFKRTNLSKELREDYQSNVRKFLI